MASLPQTQTSAAGSVDDPLHGRPWLAPLLVCAISFLTYAGTLRFQFVYDDLIQIVGAPQAYTWANFPKFFTLHSWALTAPSLPASNWRPLLLVWFFINHSIFGLHAWGWHLTSVLCHVAASYLVYRVVLTTSGKQSLAAVTGLIFGVHPVTIETVAWVSGVTDSLMSVFLLPAFLFYLGWRERRDWLWMTGSVVLFASALLVKETAIVFPVLVAWHEWLHNRDSLTSRLRSSMFAAVPYALAAVAYLIARGLVLKAVGEAQTPASWSTVVLAWPSLLWFYLRMLAWPADVSPYYDYTLNAPTSFAHVLPPLLGLVAVAAAVIVWTNYLRRRPAAQALDGEVNLMWTAAAWATIPILPVLYLRALPPDDFAHVRYLYLPCVGFSMLVALALSHLRFGPPLFGAPASKALVSAAIIVALGLSTTSQQIWWANNLLLRRRGVDIAPENPRALTGLGVELGTRGQYEKAIPYFEAALKINPSFWFANYNLGFDYLSLGRYRDALPYLQKAAEPRFPGSQQFGYLAVAQWKVGQLSAAEASMREALRRDPNGPNYHYLLGLILADEGRNAEAQEQFRAELAINPNHSGAREKLR